MTVNKCSLLLSCVCLCLCLNRVSLCLPRLTLATCPIQIDLVRRINKTFSASQHRTQRRDMGKKNSAPYLFILWVIDGCAAATVLLVLKSHGALRQRCSHEPLVCEKPMCVIVRQFVCLCVFLDFERWRKKDICVRRQCQLHLNYVNNSP